MGKGDGFDWYKRYPKKFIRGVRGLGPDVIGAYAVILDLIYEDEDGCPHDTKWLGGILGCSSRKAGALVDKLIERGKLHLDPDGKLRNSRAEIELETRAKPSRNLREPATKPSRTLGSPEVAGNKTNGIVPPREEETQTKTENREYLKERKKEAASGLLPGLKFPPWWPSESWAAFVEMRKKKRAPPTERAVELCIAELTKLRAAGHDPTAVIEQSIMRGWTGLFPVKTQINGHAMNGATAPPFENTNRNGWEGRMRIFLGIDGETDMPGGTWSPRWGPKPGEVGCKAPVEVLAKFPITP